MNDLLGSNFITNYVDKETASSIFFGMEFDFYTHDFVNDCEINFEDYKYTLGLTTYWGIADLRDMQVSILASIAHLFYRRMQISEGIIVYDMQRLLAEYEERVVLEDRGFFDKVSNEFVEIPQHFVDLENLAFGENL